MDIKEMHVMFRQYAQQMGMQNIRAVLPEQIDLVINTSIGDVTNQLIRSSVGVNNDRIITDNSKIQQINSLRTLYKVKDIEIIPNLNYDKLSINLGWADFGRKLVIALNGEVKTFTIPVISSNPACKIFIDSIKTELSKILPQTNWSIKDVLWDDDGSDHQIDFILESKDGGKVASICLTSVDSNATAEQITAAVTANTKYANLKKDTIFVFEKKNAYSGKLSGIGFDNDYLFAVDFSVSYKKVTKGYNDLGAGFEYTEDAFESNIFPVRLIDDVFLADTLNDFQLSPKLRSPIIVQHDDIFDLYFPTFTKKNIGYVLHDNLLPYKLRFAYIAKPAVVKYDVDLLGDNVDCDLPEHLHIDIVKHAVELYMQAIGRGAPPPREGNNANDGASTSPQQVQQ